MLNTSFPPWPKFSKDEAQKIKKVLLSNKVNYWTGEECILFENEFAEYFESKYAIALSNGTVALDLALRALNVGPDDEVIVTPRSFIASVSSIVNLGAKPIFIDVCDNSQNIDVDLIEKEITPKTKAILCVHLAGWPCDMKRILDISKKYGLKIIEDCAQAHGAKYRNQSVGSFGDIGCWSFCQDKIMTTGGEGGMVTTNSKKLWSKMWSFKDHGKSFNLINKKTSKKGFKWLHTSFGTNYRMTEIQASIGRIQLTKIKEWSLKRNKFQEIIWNEARKIKGLRVPSFKCRNCACDHENQQCFHASYKTYIFIEDGMLKKNWNAMRIVEEINKNNIPCMQGTCPEIYLEKAFTNAMLAPKERLSKAKKLGETSLSFLVHPTLKRKHIINTCNVLKSVMSKAVKSS